LALVATAAAAAIILSGCSGAQRNEPAGLPSGPAVPEVGAASSWVASLSAPLPADLPASPSAACALITRPAGWLRIEDAQPGDAGFRIPPEADGAGVVRGYTDRSSAACGDEVTGGDRRGGCGPSSPAPRGSSLEWRDRPQMICGPALASGARH
jgi:hypothetical protein